MRIGILLLVCALLAGCGGETGGVGAAKGPLRHETACAAEGLARAQRHTIVLLDEASLTSADARAFRERNPNIIDAIMAVADAEIAVGAGALAPRERVSLYLAPADGTAMRMLFTGCAPALTAEERQQIRSAASTLQRAREDFFATGAEDEMAEQASNYRASLLGAIQHAGERAPAAPPQVREFARSSLVQALRSTPRLVDPALGVPRLVLIAPRTLAALPSGRSTAEQRAAGFAAAREANLNMGLAELNVALAPGAAGRDFATAFFLGSGANLVSWSTQSPTGLAPPPTEVRALAGEIQYGGARYPIELRLASQPGGTLVNSWVLIRGSRPTGTPLTGSIVCADERCRVIGDDGGFAQIWSADPGGEPEFTSDLPFAGLRNIEIMIDGDRGEGRVFDPVVDEVSGRRDIRFSVRRVG